MDCPSQKNNISKEQIPSQKALWIFKSQGLFHIQKMIKTNFILKKLNAFL